MRKNKELVKLYYEELWNKKNKDLIDELFEENFTFHGSLGLETKGRQEFEGYMDVIFEGIPNLFHSIIHLVEDKESNSIAVRALYNGKHTGKLFEFEASNNKIVYNGASFFRFSDGKIADIWVLGDLNSLTKQLSNGSDI